MTLLGKVFTGLVFLLSVIFFSLAVAVNASHINQKTRAETFSKQAADAQQKNTQLIALLATKPTDLLRAGGTLGLVLLVLALVLRLAQASAWMLALLQPLLVGLPLLAGLAAVVYLVTDQLFSLPISVLVPMNPLQAFRRSRAAIDPHWIQALGLTLLLGLVVLAGFLLLVVGLAGALPLAACTLVAAYRQVFAVRPAQSPRNPA